MNEPEFLPLAIAVLTVSDTRTEADDASGSNPGGTVDRRRSPPGGIAPMVPDDIYRIRAVVSGWIADPAVQVVLITGGTGMTGRDSTPEAIRPLLDKEIDGFGELFRMLSLGGDRRLRPCNRGRWAGWRTRLYFLPARFDRRLPHRLGSHPASATGRPHPPCNLVELLPRLRER
jgi:molybdenum cofactor biosynthesis protein B